jgi:WD40 repeat protein
MLPVPGEVVATAESSSCAYDVFVVHAAADESFVQGYLIPKLALEPERVLVPGELRLGGTIIEEIERGVQSSRATIVVLSPAYMADHGSVFGEQLAAYASVAKDVHGVLLPLLLQDCDLPVHIRALVALDFRDPTRDAWDREIHRLRTYLDCPAVSEPELRCPYPGMRPFTPEDAGRFFGRDLELDRIVRWLHRGTREFYVIGASGSGKSSLIAAGLAPKLTRGIDDLPRFHVRTLRPGEQPLDRLAAALESDGTDLAAAIGSLLARHAPAGALLLVIDQLEELFAIAHDDQRRAFLAALRMLRSDARCVLAFTLRADFYSAFLESPLWSDRNGEIARIDLGPPRSDDLRTIVERPARELGVYFQPELVSRLLDDAAHEPGALPLLQETLFRLWGKRRGRLLALADYHALGDGERTGLAFAVKEHADDVIGSLSAAQKQIAFRILLRLVNFGEGRADTRRQQPLGALRSDGEAAADFEFVLQRLVENRLVTVAGDDQRGDIRVDLAHEILIHAWSTLSDWIRTWRALEQRRRELEADAAAWRARGSSDSGLLDHIELSFAVAWRANAGPQLGHSESVAAFLAASKAALDRVSRQRRRRLQGGFAAVVVFAMVIATLALVARSNAIDADRQRRVAEAFGYDATEQRNDSSRRAAELYQENASQWLIGAARPLEALPYLVAAREVLETSGDTPSLPLRMLFAEAAQNLFYSSTLQHPDRLWSAAFSPDGTCVVTAGQDHAARIWTVRGGMSTPSLLPHRGPVNSAVFSPDHGRVVTASEDGTARVWNRMGDALSPPLPHRGPVNSAVFSPDGERVVTASEDGTAQIWSFTGSAVSPPLRHRGPVNSAVFSPDGKRVVTASADHTARVWDVVSGRPLSPPLRHEGNVYGAAFSRDGTRIVTASEDHTARIWDVASGHRLSLTVEHQGAVVSAMFSPDGERIVTASSDSTARVWDAVNGKPLTPLLVHDDIVNSAAFSPDGTLVVTASDDKSARVWDAASGLPITPLLEHQGRVETAAFSSDGARVVTASDDHTARTWHLWWNRVDNNLSCPSVGFRDGSLVSGRTRSVLVERNIASVWDTHSVESRGGVLQDGQPVQSVELSDDDKYVIIFSAHHIARIWDADSRKPVSPPLPHRDAVLGAALSPDGKRAVTASADRTARIWDAGSGKPVSPPLEHQGAVNSAAFSPDGTLVVTASADHTARIWDVASGKPISPPLEHPGIVSGAGFSPDGSLVVTIGADGVVRVWDRTTGNPLSPRLRYPGLRGQAAGSRDTRLTTIDQHHVIECILNLPQFPTSLDAWRSIADRNSPYIVAHGVLSRRTPLVQDASDTGTPAAFKQRRRPQAPQPAPLEKWRAGEGKGKGKGLIDI